MKTWIKYILLSVLGSLNIPAFAQFTMTDLKLVYEPLICASDGSMLLTVDNFSCFAPGAGDGVFTIDWGDGTSDAWAKGATDSKKNHTYANYGTYSLKLSWNNGSTLEKTFPFTLKRTPQGTFTVKSSGSCINQNTQFELFNYEQNTAETKYKLFFQKNGDYQPFKDLTQMELEAISGIVGYIFKETMCDRMVLLQVTNACVDSGLVKPSEVYIPMTVLAPLNVSFKIEPEPVCTGSPFTVKLAKDALNGCGMNVQYEWVFTDNGKYLGDNPKVNPYYKDGVYNVSLVSTIKNYPCASDTSSYDMTVIKRAVADFEVSGDTVCIVGNVPAVVNFTNKSSGDNIIENTWYVSGSQKSTGRTFSDFSYSFSNPGEYDVLLEVRNSCSDSIKKVTIFVKQDPHIEQLVVPDTLCPGSYAITAANVVYLWNLNRQEATWKITSPSGGVVESNLLYPVLNFTESGKYNVSVTLKGTGCGGTTLTRNANIWIVNQEILGTMDVSKQPVDGVISLCNKDLLSFTSHYTGEGLKHYWTIANSTPGTLQIKFAPGSSAASESPAFEFTGYGDCILYDQMSTRRGCGQQRLEYKVHVGKDPFIYLTNFPADICPRDYLNTEMNIFYNWTNTPPSVEWTFAPGTVEYLHGTTLNSQKPHVRFENPGNYSYTVKIGDVGCPDRNADGNITTVSTYSGTIRVRQVGLNSTLQEASGASEVCMDGTLIFTNSANDPEGVDLRYKWEIEPVPGTLNGGKSQHHEFLQNSETSMVGVIKFTDWGTYDVKGIVFGYCDTVSHTLRILVKKNPSVTLRDSAVCPGIVDMADYVGYNWYNNTQQVKGWTVSRTDGADQPGDYLTDAGALTTLYPKIDFRRPGSYKIKVELNNAGCPATDPYAEQEFIIYDPQILGDITLKDPVAGQPLKADICEGQTVGFENTTTEEAGNLSWKWTVETTVADGFLFDNGLTESEAKAPVLTFSKYGEYKVKVVTNSTCNAPSEKVFEVSVHGVPEVTLASRMEKICAGGSVDLSARYLTYGDKKNNVLTYVWAVQADRVVARMPVLDPAAAAPLIEFPDSARYTVNLKIPAKCASGGELSLTSHVDVIGTFVRSAFTVGRDSVGCVNEDYLVRIQEQAQGDSLEYRWTISPAAGWEYQTEDKHNPVIRILEKGFYNIRLHVQNMCGPGEDSVFRLKAYGVPVVDIRDVSEECEPYTWKGRDQVVVNDNNDAVGKVKWTLTPLLAGDSVPRYLNGTSDASFYPELRFWHSEYEVKAQFWNRCSQPGEKIFTVKVDEFMPVEAVEPSPLCVLSGAVPLQANLAGGTWFLKDNTIPQPEKVIYDNGSGSYFFNPLFDPYTEQDVEVVYRRDNRSCKAYDTVTVHIWPLPHVEVLDKTPFMCLNNEPQLLTGRELVGGVWEENGGHWEVEGRTLVGHKFTPSADGSFPLKYFYTDGNSCTNKDSAVMTVHPLPNPDFKVEPMNCIDREVVFTPLDPEGNEFVWNFGDSNPEETSAGEIRHVYADDGYKNIQNITTSGHGCKDTSDVKMIEIVNNPPQAYFNADVLSGCPDPSLEVNFSVIAQNYADNHNHLAFGWDYGDGTTSDTLNPVAPKHYFPGLVDTTYTARFTVSNMCDTTFYDREVAVFSIPRIKFALMHKWDCSPVVLEIQNTTTGSGCNFNWEFQNKRTGVSEYVSGVRNPVHEFTTDGKATVYRIILTAANKCKTVTHEDSLMVKSRTISAHFTPLENPYACVDQEITFRNNSTDTLGSILNVYWNFGDGGRDSTWHTAHGYDKAGTYQVSLLIDNGCGWDTVSSPVKIYPLPKLEIVSPDYLCEEDTFTFVVRSDQILSRTDWNFGDGNKGYKDSLVHVYAGYGTFPVRVVGVSAQINHCTDSVMKEVTVYNKPIVDILPLDTALCSPLFYKPDVSGEGFFNWDFGDGSGMNSSGEHWYENLSDTVQKFTVKAFVETDKGCKSEYLRNVTVYNLPRAIIDKKVENSNPQRVTFLNLSEGATDAIWELPFKGMFHSLDNQLVEFHTNGTYKALLIALNNKGCSDSVEIEHEVLIKGLYFPNSFIPHSLNSKVSRFNGIGIGIQKYKLEIFDEFGNKIWETSELKDGMPSEGWDGCNRNGKLMPQGVYIWRAEAIFGDDEVWAGKNNPSGIPQTTQGTVLLLRQ